MIKANKKYPILVSIPHASTFVPVDLRRRMLLSDKEILSQSDLYTDEIYDVPNVHIVKAKISRIVVDMNRAPDDIEAQCKLCNDGVVVSVDEFGTKIYEEPVPEKEILERVVKYHETFHQQIDDLSGKVKFLIDGHSFWNFGPPTKDDAGKERPDISIGNREHTTCSKSDAEFIARFFEDRGFSVKINDPYIGKYVIGYHCSRRGLRGCHIEINRKLFMNEKTLRPHKQKIAHFNSLMQELIFVINDRLL